MNFEGRRRVVIENVEPEIDGGRYPVKRVIGEKVIVRADIFTDGHDEVSAVTLYRKDHERSWREISMKTLGNDRWEASFSIEELCKYYYTIRGRVDHFKTWQKDLQKKLDAGQDIRMDLLVGAEFIQRAVEQVLNAGASSHAVKRLKEFSSLLREEKDISKAFSTALSQDLSELMKNYSDQKLANTYDKELCVIVDRQKALFSAWYELFPRSCGQDHQRSGTFEGCEKLLPEISRMGFDVLYLPPIHPIGKTHRKGKNNMPRTEANDPGSPWAIGSEEGGHKSVHPDLGTLEDFQTFVKRARAFGLETAMDLAFQCSPDHPYITEHPRWFKKRPDGSIQYAENPPKKYEDIVPLNFETDDWEALWEELKHIAFFWINKGIRIFRVDNPHTKPFPFWEWFIGEVKKEYPEVLFLAEAFTRPKVMYRLAKIGFSQSYTYFTWRNNKRELMTYFEELKKSEVREYFRPHFWPNTPDILPEYLQYGGKPAFITRYILAATLSSNYGIYGPAFEHCLHEALFGKEEYLHSEKYEIKKWDWDKPGTLNDLIATVNRIRKQNSALHFTWNLEFYEVDNDYLLAYGKTTEDLSNQILILVNLDPYHTQNGFIRVPIDTWKIAPKQPYLVHDLLSDEKYIWHGERNYVEINPFRMPAHIFRVYGRLRREVDFDYFM